MIEPLGECYSNAFIAFETVFDNRKSEVKKV